LEFLEKYQVKKILADLSEKGDWYDEFNGKETVINLAVQISSPNPDLLYRNNVLVTKNVLEAAKNAGVRRIIHFGSAAVYSVRKDDYAQTKLDEKSWENPFGDGNTGRRIVGIIKDKL
jgi:nucleoside-diphosphate-sugar epimerase